MNNEPVSAVLVRMPTGSGTIDRWCERLLVDGHLYAYRDVESKRQYAPLPCTEIREGFVRLIIEEVKP